jgi:pectate lyase
LMLALGAGIIASGQQVVDPSFQGFGAFATGAGLHGTPYVVTTLANSGAGSFRDAVSQRNRNVTFAVSGYIKLSSELLINSDITIDGSSAPGLGVSLYGATVSLSGANNVIVRYLKFRQGIQGDQHKSSVTLDNASNIILDHVSIEWGRWDNLEMNGVANVTVQHSIIGDGIPPQQFGCLCESSGAVTLHHNLWINNESRNPKAKGEYQIINNVIYNWGVSGTVGGHSQSEHSIDIIGNYYIAGPTTGAINNYFALMTATDHVYSSGNFKDLNTNGVLDGDLITDADLLSFGATSVPTPGLIAPTPVVVDTAQNAFAQILKNVGDSLHRDSIDAQLIADLASIGTQGAKVTNPGIPTALLPPTN